MTATQIKNLTLRDVIHKFELVPSRDRSFFLEWQQDLPNLGPDEDNALAEIETEYFYLSQQPMAEGAVKMVVLSRLFSLAGFYRSPFTMTTEYTVKIQAVDDGKTLRGVIDILVLHDKLWALLVESKRNTFSLEPALPQALTYMCGSPHPEYPTFGLISNGANSLLLKLHGKTYAQSKEFSLRNVGDLSELLQVLKRVGTIVQGFGASP
jgi:hypothetical protein